MTLKNLRHTLSPSVLLAMLFVLTACDGGGSSGNPVNNSPQSDPVAPNNITPNNIPPNNLSASSCAFELPPGTVTVPTTLFNTDSACDYYISGGLSVKSDLTIEPGTTILVAKDKQIQQTDGALNAVGTADKRITIRGESSQTGFWQGITLLSARPSRVEYVDIMDGGNASSVLTDFHGGLVIWKTETSLVNISVSNSFVVGLRIQGDSVITEFSNNRFLGNSLAGIQIPSKFIPILDEASDYIGESSPNGQPYIHIRDSFDLGTNDVWKKLNAPYFLERGVLVSSGEQFTVMPGVELLINRGKIHAFAGGSFRFEGTAAAPIIVKSSTGQAGSWSGFSSTTGAAIYLTHTEIDGAVNGVHMDGRGSVDISHSVITNSTEWGIYCNSNIVSDRGTLTVSGNMRYINNTLGEIGEKCIVE